MGTIQRATTALGLAGLLTGPACTAEVDDRNPFATVGMTGASAGTAGPSSGSGDAGSDGDSSADDASAGSTDDGGSTGGDESTDDGQTTGGDCDPPCAGTEVCEAGQCVAPGFPGVGQLVVTEFMANPELSTDDDGEWLELTNVGTAAVDLEGCVLYDSGSDEDVIDSGAPIVVTPGQSVVLAKSADMGLNGGVAGVVYAFGTSYTLANEEDEIRLECGGVVIDEVAYTVTWPFGAGVAAQLDAGSFDATSNDGAGSWCQANTMYGIGDLGTPGQANVGC